MTNKKRVKVSLPGDADNRFEDDHFILHYRPKIEFVEPDQESIEYDTEEEKETIDSLRDRTRKLIVKLDASVKLLDLTQKRIDDRVKSSGGLTIKLDPVVDAATIAAMKRRFPEKEDPTQLTYDDYKSAINCIHKSAPPPPFIDSSEIQKAQSDPVRTNFGGLENQHGENRSEISSPISTVKPVDLKVFQKAAVLALFAMMLPLIKLEDKKEIALHNITAKHM